MSSLRDEISTVTELPVDYSWNTREYYGTGIRETQIKTAPIHASADWYLENCCYLYCIDMELLQFPLSHTAWLLTTCLKAFNNFVVRSNLKHYSLFHILEHWVTPLSVDCAILVPFLDRVLKSMLCCISGLKDMASHSACDFGGGRAENLALAKYRQVIWQGIVLKTQFSDEELRNQGRCPLTPEEIGLLLAALGFINNTRLYLASHKVYGGEARISTLRKLFTRIEDKRSLAADDERGKVEGRASLLAAVDYYGSMHSDIFISASPGNMHNAMLGYRAYQNLKTIGQTWHCYVTFS